MRWARFLGAVAVGMFLMAGLPANSATVEPTAAIDGFHVKADSYTTKQQVDCTGQTPFTGNSVRIQATVHAVAKPSEFFDVHLAVYRLAQLDNDPPLEEVRGAGSWSATWLHQNIPPSTSAPWWQLDGEGASAYGLQDYPGPWRIEETLTTRTTGQTFSFFCDFVVG